MGEYKQLKLYSQDSPGRELMEDLKGALENVKIQMARNFQNCGKPRQAIWAQPADLVTRGYQKITEGYQKMRDTAYIYLC